MKRNRFEMEILKHRLLVDPNYANNTWKILEHAIMDILTNHKLGTLSFENLYRHAYEMVLHNFGEKLYSGIVTTMTSHLSGISKLIEDAQEEFFLEELNQRWADHNKALQMILNILMYMEIAFIPRTHKTPILELGFNLWRDIVMPRTRLRDTLLELVYRERNGEVINRELMRNIIKMLKDLGSSVYDEDFEQPFLEVSADFYSLNSSLSLIENMALLDMIVNDKYEDLGMQYNLFRRVPAGLSIVRDVLNLYIWDTGKQLVADLERLKDPVNFVQCLLDLKDKFDKNISLEFNNDNTFQNALNSSFEYFINLKPSSPEFISLFVDDKLRKGLKGLSEDGVEVLLDRVMMLFRYLQKKDMFEMYYSLHLANRLSSGKTISIGDERSLIDKLKTECRCQFTSKLEGMLIDMKTSQDTSVGGED
uniref:Cullin family profile domain-containing protein n=1 Tax=Quercus lobata TaxID=97700 RepID=A0A7N2L0K6_QUELO